MTTVRTEEPESRSAPPSQPTTDDVPAPGHTDRWGIWFRRAFLCLLVVIVIAGVTGFLGVKARTVQARRSSAVPRSRCTTRRSPGPGSTCRSRSRSTGRAVSTATRSCSRYRARTSSCSTAAPSTHSPAPRPRTLSQVQWTFDPPDGDTLVVSVDMQVQYGRHWGRAGTVSLLDDQAKPVVTTSFKTWLSP